jgi:L,D-peptidoglycan transpeptidase YkuD (ErfK/YbiS/YcfS/YnhG family)
VSHGEARSGRILAAIVVLCGTAAVLCGPAGAPALRETAVAADEVSAPASTMPASVDGLSRLQARVQLGLVADDQRARAGEAIAAAEAAALSARQEAAEAAAEAAAERDAAQRAAAPSPAGPRPASPPAAPAQGAVLPLGLAPTVSDQVVTVVAPSSGASTATLTAWQRGPQGWTAVLGPVPARIGSAGVGQASETTSRTPAGTFGLTEAFGRQGNPGTALPYRVIDPLDWWVSDSASPLYNQHARCAAGGCPFDEAAGENLWSVGGAYDRAVVIDYNRGGTPGAGSAFFLHVSNGAPTAGCVAVDAGTLTAVLRWLDPAAAPVIAIGVG